jgi:hypothetical protein
MTDRFYVEPGTRSPQAQRTDGFPVPACPDPTKGSGRFDRHSLPRDWRVGSNLDQVKEAMS